MLAQMNDEMKLQYGPMVEELAQVALTADQGAVAEIIGLLEDLIVDFETARDNQGMTEEQAIEAYNQYVGALNDSIAQAESDINQANSDISAANQSKSNATDTKNSKTQERNVA